MRIPTAVAPAINTNARATKNHATLYDSGGVGGGGDEDAAPADAGMAPRVLSATGSPLHAARCDAHWDTHAVSVRSAFHWDHGLLHANTHRAWSALQFAARSSEWVMGLANTCCCELGDVAWRAAAMTSDTAGGTGDMDIFPFPFQFPSLPSTQFLHTMAVLVSPLSPPPPLPSAETQMDSLKHDLRLLTRGADADDGADATEDDPCLRLAWAYNCTLPTALNVSKLRFRGVRVYDGHDGRLVTNALQLSDIPALIDHCLSLPSRGILHIGRLLATANIYIPRAVYLETDEQVRQSFEAALKLLIMHPRRTFMRDEVGGHLGLNNVAFPVFSTAIPASTAPLVKPARAAAAAAHN